MRERTDRVIEHDAAMVQNFLELGRGFAALMWGQIGLATHINRVQDGPIVITGPSKVIRRGGSESLNGTGNIPLVECQPCAEGWKEVELRVCGFRKPLGQIVCQRLRLL